MAAYNPDVVVYLTRGETFDQAAEGRWQNLGQPAFDRYVESRYSQAAAVLGSKGASVVLMTTPYYDSGVAPAGGPWPEDDPARVSTDHRGHAAGGQCRARREQRGQGLRVRSQRSGLARREVHGVGRSGQRALHGRSALRRARAASSSG